MLKKGAKIPTIEDGELTTEPRELLKLNEPDGKLTPLERDSWERTGRKILIVGEPHIGMSMAAHYAINRLGEHNVTIIDRDDITPEGLAETMRKIGNEGLVVFDDFDKHILHDNIPPRLHDIAPIAAPYLGALGVNSHRYHINQNEDFNRNQNTPRKKSEPRENTKFDVPLEPVKRVVPNGCRVWPEYGNVVANNEKNAKRKFENLKNTQSGR